MAYKFPASPALIQPATGSAAVYALLATAKSAGWNVLASSDGTSLTTITSGGTGTGGLGNNYAWFVIQTPDGQHALGVQRGTTDTAWLVVYSPASAFGIGTATVLPVPTDGIAVLGTQSPVAFSTWFSSNGSYHYSCCASTVAPYFLASFAYPLAGGSPNHGFFYDGVVFAAANDPDAYLSYANTGSAYNVDVFSRSYIRGTWEGASANIEGVQWPFYPGNGFSPDPATGADEGFPCLYYDNQVGNKGGLATILWGATGNATYPRPTGTTYSLDTSRDRILVGFCILPWDGSTVGSNYTLETPLTAPSPTPTPSPSPSPSPTPSSPTSATHAATQGQMIQMLLGLFPPSWIPQEALDPVAPSGQLYALFGAMGDNLGRTGDLVIGSNPPIKHELRLTTMRGNTLDLAAADFYGTGLSRLPGESDAHLLNRIQAGIFVPRITRPAIFSFLSALCGVAPRITELQLPSDCGAYSATAGAPYASGGKYLYAYPTVTINHQSVQATASSAYGVDTAEAPFRFTHAQGGYQSTITIGGTTGALTPGVISSSPVPVVGNLPAFSSAYQVYLESALPLGAGAQLNAVYGYGSSKALDYGSLVLSGSTYIYQSTNYIPGAGLAYTAGTGSGYGLSWNGFFSGWGPSAPVGAGYVFPLTYAQLALLQQLSHFLAQGVTGLVGFRPAAVIGAGDWTH